jgi:hypothetical protein
MIAETPPPGVQVYRLPRLRAAEHPAAERRMPYIARARDDHMEPQ